MRTQFIHSIKTFLCLGVCASLLTACGFFDKDNTPVPTPLTSFAPEAHPQLLWSTTIGKGPGDEYLKMTPALDEVGIYTTTTNGVVTAINKANGRMMWQVALHVPMIAGPGAGNGLVVVGSSKGQIIALGAADGRVRWQQNVAGEILANPAVGEQSVVIKNVNGDIRAYSLRDGHEQWSFLQTEPSLILRAASAPLIRDQHVIAGFASGNLAMLNLPDGQVLWQQTIAIAQGAFAIQRMIDIDANPIVYEHNIYVATYQGKIASLDWTTGKTLWSHDISSYTGMVADNNTIYLTDAQGFVWAYKADDGFNSWRQAKLEARVLTAPALTYNYLIVGDKEGYLHWLSKRDGHFVARLSVGSPLYATPITDADTVYVLTSKGKLFAYR